MGISIQPRTTEVKNPRKKAFGKPNRNILQNNSRIENVDKQERKLFLGFELQFNPFHKLPITWKIHVSNRKFTCVIVSENIYLIGSSTVISVVLKYTTLHGNGIMMTNKWMPINSLAFPCFPNKTSIIHRPISFLPNLAILKTLKNFSKCLHVKFVCKLFFPKNRRYTYCLAICTPVLYEMHVSSFSSYFKGKPPPKKK